MDFRGGTEGARTLDLRVANAALSQLSYDPVHECYYNTIFEFVKNFIFS